jgi:hypothetical protein
MNKPLTVILAGVFLLAGAAPGHATLKIQKEARKEGFPAAACV